MYNSIKVGFVNNTHKIRERDGEAEGERNTSRVRTEQID